jgi:hypothetical protein
MHYNTITVLYFRVTVVNWGFDIVANTQVSVGSTTSFATIKSPIDNCNSSKTALLFLQYVTPFLNIFCGVRSIQQWFSVCYIWGLAFYSHVIKTRGGVWAHKTSLTTPLFIEIYVPNLFFYTRFYDF